MAAFREMAIIGTGLEQQTTMADFEPQPNTLGQAVPPRIGIFGGSFDPVHVGHLLVAEYCRDACQLDQIWWMPSVVAPHKQHRQPTSAEMRVEMLRLAISGHASFHLSTLEIERGGVSYTVETLEAMRAAEPAAELYFLMGADSLDEFPTWRDPARICQLATLVCVRRFGAPEPNYARLADWVTPERLEIFRAHQVDMPRIELSSTDIRQRVSRGQSIRYQTSRAVEEYIRAHRLYADPPVSGNRTDSTTT